MIYIYNIYIYIYIYIFIYIYIYIYIYCTISFINASSRYVYTNDPQVCLYYSTLFQLDQPDIGNNI